MCYNWKSHWNGFKRTKKIYQCVNPILYTKNKSVKLHWQKEEGNFFQLLEQISRKKCLQTYMCFLKVIPGKNKLNAVFRIINWANESTKILSAGFHRWRKDYTSSLFPSISRHLCFPVLCKKAFNLRPQWISNYH
jgi:hypothetical protein